MFCISTDMYSCTLSTCSCSLNITLNFQLFRTAEGNKEDMIIGAQCEVIKGDVASVQFMVGIPIRCNNAVHLDGDGT